ncbi:hypothetical protein LCGC14_0399270 [marine sediment metagenome]|uniref:Capsid protein n=1 Tax=marine sediment metagenome TaxID=412755 RepID=A0A0F9VJA3_9ZZZZ
MGQDLSNFAGALKRDYHGPIVDALNNLSILYSQLDKNEEDVQVSGEGFSAYIPIKVKRNVRGVAVRAEGGVLPTAGHTTVKQLVIPLMYNYGGINFTGQVIKASAKSATSFAKVADLEVKDMVTNFRIGTNRQMFAPASGYLCQTNGADQSGSNSTVTVNNPGTQWFEVGMTVQSFPDTTSGAASGDSDISQGLTEPTSHMVGNILSSTTFQLNDYTDAEITTEKWATDRFIFNWGARTLEMNGLMDIIDNYSLQSTSSWFGLQLGLQTIHGLSRSTYPILESNIEHGSNSNRDISEGLLQDLLDAIEKSAGKQQDNRTLHFITTYGVRKMYADLLQADRRYMKPVDLKGGWKTLAYQSGNDLIPFIVDKHCTPNTVFCFDTRYLKIYRAGNFDWMDFDGHMFRQKVDTSGRYDVWEAMMYCYMNLGCSSFRNQGALRDISES